MINKIKKQKLINLRKKGYSFNEISKILNISKSTASLLTKTLVLSAKAKLRIATKIKNGQLIGQKIIKEKNKFKENIIIKNSKNTVKKCKMTKNEQKILCSMIYYCEGNKSTKRVCFINSDPILIKKFLNLFRKSFVIDESKFRVCIHLHSYHTIKKQLNFWSKCTNIPLSNFIKPFMKKSSGLYKKKEYQGCASIRYYDSCIAKELKYLAIEYMNGPIG